MKSKDVGHYFLVTMLLIFIHISYRLIEHSMFIYLSYLQITTDFISLNFVQETFVLAFLIFRFLINIFVTFMQFWYFILRFYYCILLYI